MDKGWTRLLRAELQPQSVRETYELVGELMRALARPADLAPQCVEDDEARRLGYLVMATMARTGARVDDSWRRLAVRLLEETPRRTAPVVLFVCEKGSTWADHLAALWGLARGVDHMKLVQIADRQLD